jgi:two-component system response regulator LytT
MNASLLKILIVEDEIFIADYIQELLEETDFKYVKQANNVVEALAKLNDFNPNVVLMDINIEGDCEGIKLSNNEFKKKSIIFITAQNDFATIKKAIATNPENYLTKPIKKIDLIAAIELIALKRNSNTITVKDGYDYLKLSYDEILYIKSDNNYIDILTKSKKYTVRQSLEGFLNNVDKTIFRKIHRSYVINKTFITKITSKSVFLNEIEIPLSRNYEIEL